jgi:hypothetical protein
MGDRGSMSESRRAGFMMVPVSCSSVSTVTGSSEGEYGSTYLTIASSIWVDLDESLLLTAHQVSTSHLCYRDGARQHVNAYHTHLHRIHPGSQPWDHLCG